MLTNNKKDKPVVIYLHCSAGVDRTGEFSGAYYMKYLKWGYKKALTFDYAVEPRPINQSHENSMNFFCWKLHYESDDGP